MAVTTSGSPHYMICEVGQSEAIKTPRPFASALLLMQQDWGGSI